MKTLLLILHVIGALYDRHEGVLNLLGVSFILTMPKGKSTLYCWLRAGLQSFIGALRPHPEPPPPDPQVENPFPTQAGTLQQ